MQARLAIFVLAVCILFPGFAGPARGAEIVDRIVAVVNGEIITLYELNKKLAPHLRAFYGKPVTPEDEERIRRLQKGLLTKMVDELLLLDEAKRLELEVSETEIENHIRQIKRRNNLTEEELQRQLKIERISRDEYKERIRSDMLRFRLLSGMVSRKVLVSEEEIDRYYQSNIDEYQKEREVRLGIILLPQGQDAGAMAERIRSGELDFAQAAKEHSLGPGADEGGDIGWLKWKQIAPDWKESLKGVSEGGIGKPFDIGGRPAILCLLENKAGGAKDMQDVRDDIRTALHQPKYEALYKEYLGGLRDKALIDIRL